MYQIFPTLYQMGASYGLFMAYNKINESIPLDKEVKLSTGDILLFRGGTYVSWFLEYFGHSKYSHVGMIVKNPSFISPYLENGLYVLESTTPTVPEVEDGMLKTGVQMHHLDDVLRTFPKGSVYVRHVKCERDEAFYTKFAEIHRDVHGKPYDMNIYDWACAELNIEYPLPVDDAYRKTNTFWCSALASYIYCKLGLIQEHINWSLIAPKEFSKGGALQFKCVVTDEELLY